MYSSERGSQSSLCSEGCGRVPSRVIPLWFSYLTPLWVISYFPTKKHSKPTKELQRSPLCCCDELSYEPPEKEEGTTAPGALHEWPPPTTAQNSGGLEISFTFITRNPCLISMKPEQLFLVLARKPTLANPIPFAHFPGLEASDPITYRFRVWGWGLRVCSKDLCLSTNLHMSALEPYNKP